MKVSELLPTGFFKKNFLARLVRFISALAIALFAAITLRWTITLCTAHRNLRFGMDPLGTVTVLADMVCGDGVLYYALTLEYASIINMKYF